MKKFYFLAALLLCGTLTASAQRAKKTGTAKPRTTQSAAKPQTPANRASLMKTKLGPQTQPEYLDKEFAVRHPVNIMWDGGSNKTVLEEGSYVDVVAKKLPQWGMLIIFNVHYIDAEGPHDVTFSWSGADTHLMFSGVIYQPVRGGIRYPKDSGSYLAYLEDEGTWVLQLSQCKWMIGAGLKEGMTKEEVLNAFGDAAAEQPATITNPTKVGNLTKYSFQSYAMEKEYHLDGNHHYNGGLHNWLDLYFNAQGKLDRWITNW